jgi:cytochrome c553
MRKTAIALLILPLLVLLSPLVPLGQAQNYVGNGFANSPHDFSTRNKVASPGTGLDTEATAGACTYCHTPHRALQTRLLWNHKLPGATYTWSDGADKTVGGTTLPTIADTWAGPSKFCLSCHDGTVGIGDINWFNGAAFGGSTELGGTTLDNLKHEADIWQISQANGQKTWTSGGSDMRGNHPVAHPYPYNHTTGKTYNGVVGGAGVYTFDFRADPTTVGMRLFTMEAGAPVATTDPAKLTNSAGIECTSCHGVHNEKEFVEDEPLLRGTRGGNSVVNGKGYICMKCHPRAASSM